MITRTLTWFQTEFIETVITPVKALKRKYIPLLLIYFAYGAQGITAVATTFWEKENLTLSADQLIQIGVWVSLPWVLKMLVGQCVDCVKIFGNRRQSYIYLGAGLMTLGYIILAGMALEAPWIMWINGGDQFTLYLTSALFTVFGFMIQDVTADTMTTEVVSHVDKMGKKRTAQDIHREISMVQILGRLSLMIAAAVVAGLGGYLASIFPYSTVFWIGLSLPAISILGAFFVKLETNHHECQPINIKIFGGGLLFAAFSIFMAFSSTPWSQEIVFFASLALILVMMRWIMAHMTREQKRTIGFVLTAIFLFRMTPSVGPGFNWFAIDVLKFDQVFFGVLAQIGSLIALAVLWFGSRFIASKSVRSILIFLIFVGTILSIPELMLYYGMHDALGISAQTLAIADTALDSPLVHISMIPMLALIAFYAPAHMRGTWFAVAASLMNLALTAGKLMTKYLNQIFVVTRDTLGTDGELITQANYTDLEPLLWIVIGAGFIIPLVGIFIFLPHKKIIPQE